MLEFIFVMPHKDFLLALQTSRKFFVQPNENLTK